MTSTAVQQISPEDIKQAILALIKENNAEIMQFLGESLGNIQVPVLKKNKKKQVPQNDSPVKKERIPYSEMPFWKANPHLKPHIPEGKGGLSKDFFDALTNLHESFKDVSDEEWDEWLEQLKDDR